MTKRNYSESPKRHPGKILRVSGHHCDSMVLHGCPSSGRRVDPGKSVAALLRLTFNFIIIAVSLTGCFGQTANTRVLSTIVNPSGPPPSGRLTISWNRFQNDAVPRQFMNAGTRVVTITAGVVDVSLFPNTVALPSGTCYTASYSLSGQASFTRYWTVPVSGSPVSLNIVEGSIPCSPTQSGSVSPGQITDGGASVGQVLAFNGSYWAPGAGGGGGGSPGGTNGQLQYNNLGAFGGFTPGGDCVLTRPSFICTKTNGVAFAASATVDTTNAGNITAGTLLPARGGTGSGALNAGAVPYIGTAGVYSQDSGFNWDGTNHLLCIGCSTWDDSFTKLKVFGTTNTVLRIAAGSAGAGNYYSDMVLASGGGGAGGDHAEVEFQQGNSPKWALAGVWNGNSDMQLIDTNDGFVSRYRIVDGTGNFMLGTNPIASNYKFDVQSSGSQGTLRVQDRTPTTGITQIGVIAGANQGVSNLMLMQGSTYQGIWDSQGQFSGGVIGGNRTVSMSAFSGANLISSLMLNWRDGGSLDSGSVDLGVARNAAGVLEINNGTAGQLRDLAVRDITGRSLTGTGVLDFGSGTATRPNLTGLSAAIPATCLVGQTYFKTDAAAGANSFGCTAVNTWTVQSGGPANLASSGPGGVFGNLPVTNLNGGSGASSSTFWAGDGTWRNAAGGGTVTNTLGPLTAGRIMVGNGGVDSTVLGSLGTTTTILHGNAGGNPSFGAVVLTTDVSGILPGANGGTSNGFFAVSGPGTSLKTFAFPNASATVLTSNAAVTMAQGGTGADFSTIAKGGMLSGSGAGALVITTVGTDGQVWTASAAAPGGASWQSVVGTGTVTSIATTGPITGGTITSTGTIACATCVTAAAALTANQLLIGSGLQASQKLGSLGTTTTVLHGNAGGAPSFGAIDLTADVSGVLPVVNGGSGTSTAFTAGSVVYAGGSGVYTQDNARFFWDNTNHRLGIANNSPAYPLDVTGSIRSSSNFIVTSQAEPTCDSGGEGKINYLRGGSGANSKLRICTVLADDSFAWIPII